MKIAILGAGVIGATTAYMLGKQGHDVTIIEREPEAGMECSFANGGQLHYCHAEPWASPAILKKGLKWIFRDDAPLKFRFSSNPTSLSWLLRYINKCNNRSVLHGTRHLLNLGLYSRDIMHQIEDEIDIDFNHRKDGILHFFKDYESLNSFKRQSDYQKELGSPFKTLSREQCLEQEPALKHIIDEIVGGIYYPYDESGDVFKFTQAIAEKSKSDHNVKFMYDTTVISIRTESGKVTAIGTDKGDVTADKYIICLGTYSSLLLKTIGIKAPIYPLKGYSISIKTSDKFIAPHTPITDQSGKIVYSRLGDILRVAGTAEFAEYDDSVNDVRINMIKDMVRATFPYCGDIDNAEKWACLRPSTPDSLPILGKCKYDNLILNTGHGSLGWSHATGSAKIISDIAEDKEPEIDISAMSIDRF